MPVARGWRGGSWELLFTKFQFEKMKEFWRQTVVTLHNNMDVLHAAELYT